VLSPWDYPLVELYGKTMGIVGLGRIGRATAAVAVAMGMAVLAFDENPDKKNETGDIRYSGLDDLLARADVVSLHVPLFDSTKGMINSASIAKMKDGVIVINTSRGPLVVEEDMRQALESGKVGWYAADVVSVEPISPDNPLLSAKNCILTPHIAWAPKEARERLMNTAIDNLAAFIKSTFKENRANRRPISFKDSTAFVSMGCFFINSIQTRAVAKNAAETNAPGFHFTLGIIARSALSPDLAKNQPIGP
jgi:glycerate dehydrogenase